MMALIHRTCYQEGGSSSLEKRAYFTYFERLVLCLEVSKRTWLYHFTIMELAARKLYKVSHAALRITNITVRQNVVARPIV